MTRHKISAFILSAAVVLAPAAALAAQAKAVLIGTYDNPLYVATPPGQGQIPVNQQLMMVVEQTGKVQVLRNEVKLSQPFLDIGGHISCCGERGLLSIAFAPDYATSGRLYVAFTDANGNVEVDEYKRFGKSVGALRANPATRRLVIRIPHPDAGNHNGGQLQFGPDGFLYISIGDGGELTPRGWPARNLNDLRGKILRINPLPKGRLHYTLPSDNPFVGMAGRRPEIYAYGFRNPWRFSFDGHNIAIGDVGQSQEEEIDLLNVATAKGVNFGWPQYEGRLLFDNTQPGPTPPKFPIKVYTHDNGGCAVIGGFVSRDPLLQNLKGRYIYGDLCTGQLRSFLPNVPAQKAQGDAPIGITATNLTGFGVGPRNRLYITQQTGEVSRIAPP
ncbi:MAG TPA: PQQ-dependent sugar dehydrogenase [Pseudolabrys sp.]|nr:PQQ-dependent sugar dehydrogenase [Pseudolabrys sp.]